MNQINKLATCLLSRKKYTDFEYKMQSEKKMRREKRTDRRSDCHVSQEYTWQPAMLKLDANPHAYT